MTVMANVLILGGTGWLSGRVAQAWLDSGAAVTCLARGSRSAPEGAEMVVADREQSDAYGVLARREWDEVVDISSIPGHVAGALATLADSARHWTYVSSVSIYAANDVPGADETAPLSEPAEPGDEYDYSRAKSAAEAAVLAAVSDRAAIIRPGLIVGPGDPTDRFGYWVGRLALAGAGDVLVPTLDGLLSQVIDVDDVAEFIVDRGRESWVGIANAVGDTLPLAEVLRRAQDAAGHTGSLIQADDVWLEQHDVAHWMGPRSLPLWLPREMSGHPTRSNAVYRKAGGHLRSVEETLARTLTDERARGLDRERRSGLTRDEELALIGQARGL